MKTEIKITQRSTRNSVPLNLSRLLRFALVPTLAGLPVAAAAADAGATPTAARTDPQSAPAKAGSPSDAEVLLNLFQKKGVITDQDAKDAREALAARTNAAPAMPPLTWKISDAIKSIQLFGDARFRYEYRGLNNVSGASPDTYSRDRFRYALRVGVRGEVAGDFNYGVRLDTANNPRSPWSTFGNNTTGGSVTPSDKNGSGIYLGQAYLGWHPADWYEMTVGRMPMPLYTTPMVWDSDISPEGAFEKIKYTVNNVDFFAGFGQFDYQNPTSASELPTSDTFVLAWQVGANVRITKDMSFKIAPVFYNYTGVGTPGNGLNLPFVGQGTSTNLNVGLPGAGTNNLALFNQNGINNLSILEIPAEFNVKIPQSPLGPLQARLFGDFAYNVSGDDRARAAYHANPAAFPGLKSAAVGQNKAYQIGLGIGSATGLYGPTQGLVYGSFSRKHAWEARAYWQHIEQYALDVNLIDSDFFEGRGNLEGVYFALAYGVSDAIIATFRYGHASPIRKNLGTGGNNLDIPGINPIKYYDLVQMDLTWKF
ncbi:MAG: putative porin [Verrucomicrobia bacterium]|nr:putative porin [Verrucomicrobiota bacterium]